jgi:hypothetical protein
MECVFLNWSNVAQDLIKQEHTEQLNDYHFFTHEVTLFRAIFLPVP